MKRFKGRRPDLSRPVQVYRNLNGGKKKRWSIRQGGLVVAHANDVELERVTFVTSDAGWARAVREGQRNVHAWAQGYLVTDPEHYNKHIFYWTRVVYGRNGHFFLKHKERWQVTGADRVRFHEYGTDCISPTYGSDWQ